jgi:lysophospholipase L1-like esterase
MSRRIALLVLGICFLAPARPLGAQEKPFFFRKGDRIVFLGDSITEQYQYSSDIELYLTLRFPDWDLVFLNAGIGGDTATGGANRFAQHVLSEKPTCVTIDFGMNDGGYGGFDKNRADGYVKNSDAMLQAARKAGVRVALCSPNAVEFMVSPGLGQYFHTQQQFYAPLQGIAARYQVPFVDQYAITRKALLRMAADNASVHPFPDGVHTNGAGGLLMAHTILVGLHAPAVVSDVVIDASAGGKVVKTENCTAGELKAAADGLEFLRTDRATPLPIAANWRPLLPYVNDLRDLNWYGLKVTGLKGMKYELTIDGKSVGTYSAADIAAGVNVGNASSGPLFEQGMAVLGLINAKNEAVHGRFRGVVMASFPNHDWLGDLPKKAEAAREAELKKRLDQITKMQAEVYRKAQPKPHTFALKAAK